MRIFMTMAILISLAGLLVAEETPAAKDTTGADEAATKAPSGEETKPAAAGEKYAAYQALLVPWKKILTEMLELRVEYETAEPDRQQEIRKRYDVLRSEGRQLAPKLKEAAAAAYAENPKADPQLEDFLWQSCVRELEQDDFEPLLRDANLLLEGKCDKKQLPLLAGVAALCTNDLDAAEKHLSAAHRQGVRLETGKDYLDRQMAHFLAEPEFFKKRWQREQEFRAKEAEADDLPRVLLKTTQGDIELELFENEAPNTVANFISLVDKGFYNGLTFHRVLDGFMAQGGCPEGTGMGGPGYQIPCECTKPVHREHFRGSLSMAKSEMPDSGGSQFFLTFVPTVSLDGLHTVFGRVVRGIDVLAKIQRRDPDDRKGTLPRPDRILEAKVLRKRPHEYVPRKTGEPEK